MPGFYECFAGGGMVRAGLGPGWRCLFANDFDPAKARTYRENWGDSELKEGDINALTAADLPGCADLIWGSSPCQDLSLAGAGAGLGGQRSGTYHAFWRLVAALAKENRAPKLVAIENVTGALTSRGGADFAAMMGAFTENGYRPGAMVINAELFLPQSRPRLFVIGVHQNHPLPLALHSPAPAAPFHSPALIRAIGALPGEHIWWNLPKPPLRNTGFSDLIEAEPDSVKWHSNEETARLLSLMSPTHLARVREMQKSGRRIAGTIYKRTRRDENGERRQRAEVRFDDIAGCLRTPAGGSSRQTVLIVEGDSIRSRLISARETARLMGLEEGYKLPRRYNGACHLTGDGVVVPVVRYLAAHIFEPLLAASTGVHAA